jgi:dienelactone hydrolase
MRPPWLLASAALLLGGCGGAAASSTGTASTATPAASTPAHTTSTARRATRPAPPALRTQAPFAVGLRQVTFVDQSRSVKLPSGGTGPRKLVTLVRYPLHARGPFPLIVFGHGFAVTPDIYASLLEAWARAGYVVAAPIFPLENANAPGGPDESDLVNQPRDMSFLISEMITASSVRGGFFHHMIDPGRIAVTGQSDGGETALAVAYDVHYLDRRVSAAAILSGAEIPGVSGFDFPAPSPPLLATQGTADTVNPPTLTHAFFDIAPAPKFLLTLFGASHLGPYTDAQPQLAIVERVTIAFFDHYLKGGLQGLRRMTGAGDVAGTSVLQSDP